MLAVCGALAVGVAACGSGSSASPPRRPPSTTAAGPTTTGPAPAGPAPATAPAAASHEELAQVEQQLAGVPGLLSQAQQANSAADPDQARAAEGG